MKNGNKKAKFYNLQINLYVKDVEASVVFYKENFGFFERFRTPQEGKPIHVELELENFGLGLATITSAKEMHGLDVGVGQPRGELVLWTDDVDTVYKELTTKGVTGLSEPHTFLDTIRSAWLADPDGNPIQLVKRI